MMDELAAVSTPPAPAPQMPRTTDGDPKAVAREFEAVFIGEMTKIMMETVPTDGPFGGGHGEEMFRGIMAERLGDAIARRGGIGLAPVVMGQILKMQGDRDG
jgi:Rod binding domain-containing protein